mmetsp:Transcript_5528/g.20898  ORF Transcript_5528/g.20898 Transcript_5528/m.20898 type:complete len:221 (+) Transcript_5528:1001-1663(+)
MRGVVVGIRGKLKLQYSLKKYTLRKNHFTNFLPPPLAARLGTAAPRWFPRPGPKCRFRRPSVRSTPPRLLFSVGSPPVCRRRPTPRSFFGGSPQGPVCFRHPTTFPRTARFAETGGQALCPRPRCLSSTQAPSPPLPVRICSATSPTRVPPRPRPARTRTRTGTPRSRRASKRSSSVGSRAEIWKLDSCRARCPPRRGISAARRSPPASRVARRRWFLWW